MEVSLAQINEWDGKFANRVGWKKCEFIWAYSLMKFDQITTLLVYLALIFYLAHEST